MIEHICLLFDVYAQGSGTWMDKIVPEMKRLIM
jgi:hypothetical protein